MIRFVVFDLDGTLVDSRRDLAESANTMLAECGCPALSEEAIGRMVGHGAATLVARAFAASGCPPPPDALARFLSIYERRVLTFTRPYPGVEDVLAELAPRVPLAVLTNKPHESTRRVLEGLGLARYFSPGRVLGGDGPLPRKPDPAGLDYLIGQAGVAARETAMVGDSVIDWRTARAAGTHICMARYGFGFEGFPVERLAATDRIIDAPIQLLTLL